MADLQAGNGRGGFRAQRRMGPLGVGVAVAFLVLTAWTLNAGVIDDFNGPETKWDGVNGSPTLQLADGQLVMSQDFTNATDPANPFNTFGNIYYLTNLPVLQKQTLELRVDLMSANQDNVFTHLGTMNAAGGEYAVFKDLNEIGLLKWSATQGCSVAFWESRSIQNQGVVLILSLTPMDDRLVIETKVVRKSDQAVLYQRSVVDGPGSDWLLPTPLPHGWQILTPDAGAPYKDDLTVVWLAMQHQTDGLQGLAELRLDNLEYDVYPSPYLEIAGGATLLTWPENTGKEQIVVAADSLSGSVWMPWPEPIYKRFADFATTAATTAAQQYFKLVPGTQFIDDFDALKQPFATRNSWAPHFYAPADASRFVITNVDGALRIRTVSSAADGRVLLEPPGTNVMVRDFYASVDILAWPVAGKLVAIFARGVLDRPPNWPGATDGYLGIVNRVHNDLRIWGSDGGPAVGPAVTIDPAAHYRLVFSGSGTRLSQRLEDLTTGAVIEWSTVRNQWSQGPVGLWIETGEGGSIDITLDNFFVTGTKP